MKKRLVVATLLSLVCLTLSAQRTYTMSPSVGPVAGGTVVTIKGAFDNGPHDVVFGSTSVVAERLDAATLVVTTPAHLPGTVPITIFQQDAGMPTGLTFTFEGEATDGFDRILLPFFTYPIPGAFGSEFRTDLHISLTMEGQVDIFGLNHPCRVTCITSWYTPYTINTQNPDLDPRYFEPAGTPGLFVYIPKTQDKHAAMNLRAYDTSRAGENFGTELPLVRDEEFTKDYDVITLVGVPSDPLFRNTLRLYNAGDGEVPYIIQFTSQRGLEGQHEVLLPARNGLFEPGYLEFSDFPVGAPGPLRVAILPVTPPISAPMEWPDRWAFISVTNNETQMITTITPQP